MSVKSTGTFAFDLELLLGSVATETAGVLRFRAELFKDEVALPAFVWIAFSPSREASAARIGLHTDQRTKELLVRGVLG